MKNTRSNLLSRFPWLNSLVLLFALTATKFLYAPPAPPQTGSPGGPGGVGAPSGTVAQGQPCFGPACVPIDSGIIFLIIAGVLLGIRFVYVQRQKQQA